MRPELADQQAVEQSFFASLGNLASLYRLDLSAYIFDVAYPLNLLRTLEALREHFEKAHPTLGLILIQDETRKACLSTYRAFNTDDTLFFIPVKPLFKCLKQSSKGEASKLLLTVYAYLYKVAGLPFFSDKNSFLWDQHEIHMESVEGSTDEFEQQMGALLQESRKNGEWVRAKIERESGSLLRNFGKRIARFVPRSQQETKLKEISQRFFDLYQAFPKRNVFDRIWEGLTMMEGGDFCIRADQYQGLVWDEEDFFFDQLVEYINIDMQEAGGIDEPISFQYFDQPHQVEEHDFTFEKTIYPLLCDLGGLLYELNHADELINILQDDGPVKNPEGNIRA